MTSNRIPVPGRATVLAAALGALVGSAGAAMGQARPGDTGCVLCHGELELLRQQVPTLEDAQALLVPLADLRTSAHDTMSCRACHTGFDRFPHPARVETRACSSCHEPEHQRWLSSVHAQEAPDEADCGACHGTHDVLRAARLREPPGLQAMNATCTSCHETAALPVTDPHADSVACASCHRVHATNEVSGSEAAVAPLAQDSTCGACHEEVAAAARTDVHGAALRERGVESLALLAHGGAESPPTCTSCHGAHGMVTPSRERFAQLMTERCGSCHEHYLETFFDTYHGQANALGSRISATCSACHGSHAIFPEEDARSTVAEANLVETCGACHEHASAGFVAYEPHADHSNEAEYPYAFWSYLGMTVLLVGTLTVFGIHTALWLIRSALDSLRGHAAHPHQRPLE